MTMRRVSSVSRPMYVKDGRFGIILWTSARPRRQQPGQIQLFVPVCAFVRYPCKLTGTAYLHDRHRKQKSARRTTAVNLLFGKCILQEGKERLGFWFVQRSMPYVPGSLEGYMVRLHRHAQQFMQHQLQNLYGIILPVGQHALRRKRCQHMFQYFKRCNAFVAAMESQGFR